MRSSLRTIIGDRLRAREAYAQVAEDRLASNMLNRMMELGMPAPNAARMWTEAFAGLICRELDSCTRAQ
ncbi:MAG: hypothetical protein ACI9S9_003554 [Planctomycetota bacterium]|jgi:hypothetical protein